MIQFPKFPLRGTVRRRERTGTNVQKMVDGMLACDALYAATHPRTRVGIVADDDDLLPSALSSHVRHPQAVVWMRRRKVGTGLNDPALLNEGLIIHRLEN